jgi:hypothetical protein
MRVPILVLLIALLAGCATGAGAPMLTEEARCRQQGGVWRAATDYCDASGSGGGGY